MLSLRLCSLKKAYGARSLLLDQRKANERLNRFSSQLVAHSSAEIEHRITHTDIGLVCGAVVWFATSSAFSGAYSRNTGDCVGVS